jgi:hypothetical protein
VLRLIPAGLLGLGAALLVSCGSSNGKLIPLANAGPLQTDFEAVAQAAQTGGGSCAPTEAAILKTERDFSALPATIDAGLRSTLHQGIANLRSRALVLCAQPLAQSTAATTTPTTTTTTTTTRTTPTTPTVTETTATSTTPTTTPTTPTSTGPGGGTPAPGAGETPPPAGNGQGGGTGAGENGQGQGAGGGGQEGGGK